MNRKDQELWKSMADLTFKKCKQKCHNLGSCCEKSYCDCAADYIADMGQEIKVTGNKIPFLDNNGCCVVPPHLRPMCTLHQCDINGMGYDPKDPKWTKEYFELREKLDKTL